MPLVVVCSPFPLSNLFVHPRPNSSIEAPSGSAPIKAGSPAPCALPNVCPPATRATVSSSFIAIRAKVSRTSLPDATGSGFPFGPSGLT